jgi:hypothetical protein
VHKYVLKKPSAVRSFPQDISKSANDLGIASASIGTRLVVTQLLVVSLLRYDRVNAIMNRVADNELHNIELHDEVLEWMDALSTDEWDRTRVVIERLAEQGSMARMPFSRALGDGLFELRFTLGSTSRRITYRFTSDRRIILLTTFRKQRNNERNEIIRAREVAADCATRNP